MTPDFVWKNVQVEPNGCWIYQGSPDTGGYPRVKLKGKTRRLSRLILEDKLGELPRDVMALHSCDRPMCINPAHLFPGTHTDNMADRARKRRQAFGVRHWNAKLTPEGVLTIRRWVQEGVLHRDIAARLGICKSLVSHVVTERLWAHVQ